MTQTNGYIKRIVHEEDTTSITMYVGTQYSPYLILGNKYPVLIQGKDSGKCTLTNISEGAVTIEMPKDLADQYVKSANFEVFLR